MKDGKSPASSVFTDALPAPGGIEELLAPAQRVGCRESAPEG